MMEKSTKTAIFLPDENEDIIGDGDDRNYPMREIEDSGTETETETEETEEEKEGQGESSYVFLPVTYEGTQYKKKRRNDQSAREYIDLTATENDDTDDYNLSGRTSGERRDNYDNIPLSDEGASTGPYENLSIPVTNHDRILNGEYSQWPIRSDKDMINFERSVPLQVWSIVANHQQSASYLADYLRLVIRHYEWLLLSSASAASSSGLIITKQGNIPYVKLYSDYYKFVNFPYQLSTDSFSKRIILAEQIELSLRRSYDNSNRRRIIRTTTTTTTTRATTNRPGAIGVIKNTAVSGRNNNNNGNDGSGAGGDGDNLGIKSVRDIKESYKIGLVVCLADFVIKYIKNPGIDIKKFNMFIYRRIKNMIYSLVRLFEHNPTIISDNARIEIVNRNRDPQRPRMPVTVRELTSVTPAPKMTIRRQPPSLIPKRPRPVDFRGRGQSIGPSSGMGTSNNLTTSTTRNIPRYPYYSERLFGNIDTKTLKSIMITSSKNYHMSLIDFMNIIHMGNIGYTPAYNSFWVSIVPINRYTDGTLLKLALIFVYNDQRSINNNSEILFQTSQIRVVNLAPLLDFFTLGTALYFTINKLMPNPSEAKCYITSNYITSGKYNDDLLSRQDWMVSGVSVNQLEWYKKHQELSETIGFDTIGHAFIDNSNLSVSYEKFFHNEKLIS